MNNASFLIHSICFELIYKNSLQNNSLLYPDGVAAPQAAPKRQDETAWAAVLCPMLTCVITLTDLVPSKALGTSSHSTVGSACIWLPSGKALEIHKPSGTTLITYNWENAQEKQGLNINNI